MVKYISTNINPCILSNSTDTLLYIGALSDLSPFIGGDIPKYKHYIYVDGLPDSNYFDTKDYGYTLYHTLDLFLENVNRKLAEKTSMSQLVPCQNCNGPNCSDLNSTHFISESKNGSGIRLDYFFNTLDRSIQDNPFLKSMLQNVIAMYVAGFIPTIEVITHLPRLQHIYMSRCCYNHSDWGGKLSSIKLWFYPPYSDEESCTDDE